MSNYHIPLSPHLQSSGSSRDSAAHVLELKLKALILDTVHNIDVIQTLIRENVHNSGHWLWQKQLRCYLKKGEEDEQCLVTVARFNFRCLFLHVIKIFSVFVDCCKDSRHKC